MREKIIFSCSDVANISKVIEECLWKLGNGSPSSDNQLCNSQRIYAKCHIRIVNQPTIGRGKRHSSRGKARAVIEDDAFTSRTRSDRQKEIVSRKLHCAGFSCRE